MKRVAMFLVLGVAVLTAGPLMAGMITSEECARSCRNSYRQCKQTETADSAVNIISCAEILEMCLDRCRNITSYVSCKDKCGDDAACLETCKDDFSGNVGGYRPILGR